MTDLEDLLGFRYRQVRVYVDAAHKMMEAIERERDADVLSHGLAINAAWEAFCEADQKYWAARKEEDS